MLARVWLLLLIISISGCGARDEHTLYVGAMAGEEAQLVHLAASIAQKHYNLKVKVIEFDDYLLPNTALAEGSLDLNAYQHKPFLEWTRTVRGYDLVEVGKTFLYPMGIYKNPKSVRIQKIAIPSDPSNRDRALLLLKKHNINGTIIEMDASMLPQILPDVDIAVINTTFAITHKMNAPLYIEGKDSPYVNLLVAKAQDADSLKIQEFICAMNQAEVEKLAKKLFAGVAVAGWKKNCTLPKN